VIAVLEDVAFDGGADAGVVAGEEEGFEFGEGVVGGGEVEFKIEFGGRA